MLLLQEKSVPVPDDVALPALMQVILLVSVKHSTFFIRAALSAFFFSD
jgi:hypothetical protein